MRKRKDLALEMGQIECTDEDFNLPVREFVKKFSGDYDKDLERYITACDVTREHMTHGYVRKAIYPYITRRLLEMDDIINEMLLCYFEHEHEDLTSSQFCNYLAKNLQKYNNGRRMNGSAAVDLVSFNELHYEALQYMQDPYWIEQLCRCENDINSDWVYLSEEQKQFVKNVIEYGVSETKLNMKLTRKMYKQIIESIRLVMEESWK